MAAQNPLAIDLNRAVLLVNEAGELVQRPADEASVADSFHELYLVAQALAVRLFNQSVDRGSVAECLTCCAPTRNTFGAHGGCAELGCCAADLRAMDARVEAKLTALLVAR